MQLWYVCKENQLLGPWQEDQVLSSLTSKNISATDWIRRAEQIEWTLAAESENFKEHFLNSESEKLPFEENWHEKWVLLQFNATTNSYTQNGPFSTVELLSKIYQGTADYADYVWQQGMSEWKRVGAVDAFIPKEDGTEEIVPTEDTVSLQTIESQVIVNKPEANSFYQQLPLFEDEKFPLQTAPKVARSVKTVEKFPEYYKPIVNKRRRWWVFSFFCFILSLAIAIWGKNSLSIYL
ncbi:MAG: DUF4339 domain-containing protein [Bdellovibrionales bacterium]|nr:DUF4339 domain-containing protein [Bdellovibrionales bacterium]